MVFHLASIEVFLTPGYNGRGGFQGFCWRGPARRNESRERLRFANKIQVAALIQHAEVQSPELLEPKANLSIVEGDRRGS